MRFDQVLSGLLYVCRDPECYGDRVEMTRPTTARLLATKARDVKPGQYGYLWTGQYHFLFIFTMVPAIPYFTDSVFHVYSAILNINYICFVGSCLILFKVYSA